MEPELGSEGATHPRPLKEAEIVSEQILRLMCAIQILVLVSVWNICPSVCLFVYLFVYFIYSSS